jgi:alpha-D-ribose 1-methylphosphonate 5-triphosphate synthase subunit PhnG
MPHPDLTSPQTESPEDQTEQRRRWMAVLARADLDELTRLLAAHRPLPGWRVLRGPECGLVMVRGRAGGGGARFNLGEMTVTRCTVRTDTGHVGHAYIAGRHERQAELAAVIDALLQDETIHAGLQRSIVGPLAAAQAARRADTAAKAAATQVHFFAMRTMRS